ncbi:ADP-ribosylation factor-like protein 15 [Haliotis asinina]|uniref:ADP-ribosylation factor-like protein 15 n=1 Tax=Haliotis asinina TaxID=109174 RepID=UPI003531B735
MCDNIQLFCGLCRIGAYSVYRRLCCKSSPETKPNFSVICIGLTGAGKSALLALLSGDEFHNIPPTVGFSIKALIFEDCILDVKELGGGENVRPYWDRYFEGSQGIIFVVDSASSEEDFATAKSELNKALSNQFLRGLPLLILANHQDVEGAKSEAEIAQFLELSSETGRRQWMIQSCSVVNKLQVEAGFANLRKVLLGGKVTATENGASDVNRI